MSQTTNIMIVGVGGQGTLLASRLLGAALLREGYDVKLSEVHGMSQRGGSVVTYVRFGDRVDSPVIERGEADILLAFELLEAARWLPFLKPGGKVIVNTQRIDPMPVIMGKASYPEHLTDKLAAAGVELSALDAVALAEQAGSVKAVNVVLIGRMARSMALTRAQWHDIIRETVPPKFIELNCKAFDLGYGETPEA